MWEYSVHPTGTGILETTKTGVVNKSFHFGTTGDIPVVGDWNKMEPSMQEYSGRPPGTGILRQPRPES